MRLFDNFLKPVVTTAITSFCLSKQRTKLLVGLKDGRIVIYDKSGQEIEKALCYSVGRLVEGSSELFQKKHVEQLCVTSDDSSMVAYANNCLLVEPLPQGINVVRHGKDAGQIYVDRWKTYLYQSSNGVDEKMVVDRKTNQPVKFDDCVCFT